MCRDWKLYNIKAANGAIVPTFCQKADGKVWTLVGKVSGADTAWTYGEQSDANYDSAWEDSTTFGTPDGHGSYKNFLWDHMDAAEMMITEGGVVGGTQHNAAPVLRTMNNCLGSQSMDRFFSTKAWSCPGGQLFNDARSDGGHACTNACKNAGEFASHQDGVLNRGRVSKHVYFHAGEANGQQETNEDRAYISGGTRAEVDYPSGLGSYCTGGCATSGDRVVSNPNGVDGHSNNIGIGGDDGSHPANPSLVYSIWVTPTPN
jgi:hypothetical protein